ncbi:hypothetical protein IMG5_069690 [Ichthyophthirius multifiliis]|uniref:Prenyltransferase alpha-alpha toroid domain-containing protein n=1 Tax=Ichthyophthirius multifiliis TaxID=5932 RepID=G0QPM7_ICHMU|nr:hypothetical protein IMG5_069690 [Ichthyophthirius multifiliis]EGR32827.1 hypothetical protein IMG5_069690 [Ichthyophthirius multifiliis]|eukprot:XP_004036813.1 hypothetical protein IMG5_069690 [Ichthyophthirius multifiliis]
MYKFLTLCKNKEIQGSFLVSQGGEADMRGVYIAILIQDILNIKSPSLIDGCADFIASCQTYEGGIAPEPFGEAHSGLTYCGFAALRILGQEHKVNLNRLIYWAGQKQMPFEGGFCGRTNKLVDNCYSFWQGSIFRLISQATNQATSYQNHLLFDHLKLQAYILLCQNEEGGLFDKPGKYPDIYHTAYSLSGLSSAQRTSDENGYILLDGNSDNLVENINIVYNINQVKLNFAKNYFIKKGLLNFK